MKNKRSRGGLSRLTVAFALLALPFLQQCTQDKNLVVEPTASTAGDGVAHSPAENHVASIKLQASTPYITANGRDTLLLSAIAYNRQGVRIDTAGFELYHNNQKINQRDFATTEAGEHAFVARLGQLSSDVLTVEALQVPADIAIARIELIASTQTIIADGRSAASFDVVCFDASGQALPQPEGWALYANGKPLAGTQLTTTRHGEHQIVAKHGEITSNEVIVVARQDKAYEVVTIPVVFHIGHFGEAVGTGANLAPALIQEILDDLNRGYANEFGSTNPNAVDMRIRFRLAQTDESGKALPEKGIVRTNITAYDKGEGNNTPFNRELGLAEWRAWQDDAYYAPGSYYNIWLYPAEESWGGLANYPSISTDRPLVGITEFEPGRRSYYINTEFNFPAPRINTKHRAGITATVIHEVGHTLGLRHTFSDNNCASSDYCDDTYSYNYPHTSQACPDNKGLAAANENFMDYRGSRNTFTYDQRERARHTLAYALWFPELAKSVK